jgi:hypothetical protein
MSALVISVTALPTDSFPCSGTGASCLPQEASAATLARIEIHTTSGFIDFFITAPMRFSPLEFIITRWIP